MIQYRSGDLLKSNCDTIMHQANCFSTMGAGIARSISKIYPKAAEEDINFNYDPEERLGKFSFVSENGKTIVNLYGQYDYNSKVKQTNYKALEKAINSFLTFAKSNESININKLGVPFKMGCGLAGGNWSKHGESVLNILKRQSEKHNVDIYIYKYEI